MLFLKVMEPARDPAQSPSEIVRDMVEAGRVNEARAYLASLTDGSDEVERWRQVLAPPPVVHSTKSTGRDCSQELQWLRKHVREYLGQWVVFDRGAFLDADRSRVALHDRVGDRPGLLFVRVPDAQTSEV